MKFISICVYLTLITWLPGQGQNKGLEIDRLKYYSAISSGNITQIDEELSSLKADPNEGNDAFIGGLLMRKAGLESIPMEKMKLFKAGQVKLEKAIFDDSANVEYRFIRLMIQENAPGIVRYHKDLQKDKSYIEKSFKNLPADLQNSIMHYSKTSRILKPPDLNSKNE